MSFIINTKAQKKAQFTIGVALNYPSFIIMESVYGLNSTTHGV
jgi:hypothetical protein